LHAQHPGPVHGVTRRHAGPGRNVGNNNILINNRAKKSGLYDIELAGESQRFGFTTPTSFNNKVFQGRDQLIKVCGVDNQAFGGNQVNTTLDPCN
jgi:hypothetical protein